MSAGEGSEDGGAARRRATPLWRRLRRAPMLRSPEEAMAAAARLLPGFPPADAAVADDGAAALAVTRDGRLAVVTPARGREIGWTALRQTAAGIVAETGDRRLGILLLAGVDALAVRRLAQVTEPAR